MDYNSNIKMNLLTQCRTKYPFSQLEKKLLSEGIYLRQMYFNWYFFKRNIIPKPKQFFIWSRYYFLSDLLKDEETFKKLTYYFKPIGHI